MIKTAIRADDRGVSLTMVAIALTLLMGAAAIAIDLAALRLDRSADQKVTDSAASAGALAVLETGSGEAACRVAVAYAALNAQEIGALDASNCANFPATACNPNVAHTEPFGSGRFNITVTYPVPDDDALMTSGLLGAPPQTKVADDGDPCDRVGVQMSAVHDGLFSQLLGFDQGTTTVHSVARSFLPPPEGPPINLLLLDRFGCEVMKASGNGGIIVAEIVDPVTGEVFPGQGAVDSDASIPGGCPDDGGTIDIDGNNALIRADGPAGCPNADPPDTGDGCGFIETLAPGTPGCNWPACTAGGAGPNNPNPDPTALAARITRAPLDHRYNCRSDYSVALPPEIAWAASPLTTANEQNIPGCEDGAAEIHNLIASVGELGSPGPGWTPWSSIHGDCTVDPGENLPPINGDVWVDICPTELSIKDPVTIRGSLVVDGDLAITSSTGHLTINNNNDPGFVFMRDGVIRKDGQASLSLLETMVYVSKTSRVQMDGGSGGNLTWIAPDDEDYPFDDLALWSDSEITAETHFWAGQANLVMEGVFFVPIVTVEYAGQGEQQQTRAQFIADKLHARGQGLLEVAPIVGRAVDLFAVPRTVLIR